MSSCPWRVARFPHARGKQGPRCEVARWQRHPTGDVGGVCDEPAVELVKRSSEPREVLVVGTRGQVDIQCVVAPTVRLDRRAADQHEHHPMIREHAEQRLALGIYVTGV